MRRNLVILLEVKSMVEEIISTLSEDIRSTITEDTSVPRNVRSNVVTGLETYLMNTKDDLDLRIYSTISVLEEQINDTNIPQHARTRLFEFIRDLEGIVSTVGLPIVKSVISQLATVSTVKTLIIGKRTITVCAQLAILHSLQLAEPTVATHNW